MGRFQLESIYLYFPPSSQLVYLRPVDNVVIATKGLQDRNINTQAGTTVENKGKLILIDKIPVHHIPANSYEITYSRINMPPQFPGIILWTTQI